MKLFIKYSFIILQTLLVSISYSQNGYDKQFYENGLPKSEFNFKNGKKHGVQREWYEYDVEYFGISIHMVDEDDLLKYEHNYKNGIQDSIQKGWGEPSDYVLFWQGAEPKLEYEINYIDGKINYKKNWDYAEVQIWDDGRKYYKKDVLIYESEHNYDHQNKIIKTREVKWYKDEQIESKYEISNGNGVFSSWFNDYSYNGVWEDSVKIMKLKTLKSSLNNKSNSLKLKIEQITVSKTKLFNEKEKLQQTY
ncbi:hypothetical protein OAN33_07345, partial [Flavobacteriales bacterium]|nr:hypothetical protein [Flavobacteriales bacterium]